MNIKCPKQKMQVKVQMWLDEREMDTIFYLVNKVSRAECSWLLSAGDSRNNFPFMGFFFYPKTKLHS